MNLDRVVFFSATSVSDFRALSLLEDAEFVFSAVELFVGPDALPDGRETLVRLVRLGFSKLYVLSRLAEMAGGDFRPGAVPGTKRRLFRYRLATIPVFGKIIRTVFSVPSESYDQRRMRVLENQVYLLARRYSESSSLPCAPWGGVHREPLLALRDEQLAIRTNEVVALANLLVLHGNA